MNHQSKECFAKSFEKSDEEPVENLQEAVEKLVEESMDDLENTTKDSNEVTIGGVGEMANEHTTEDVGEDENKGANDADGQAVKETDEGDIKIFFKESVMESFVQESSVVKSLEYFAESSEKSGKEPVEESVKEAVEKLVGESIDDLENTTKDSNEVTIGGVTEMANEHTTEDVGEDENKGANDADGQAVKETDERDIKIFFKESVVKSFVQESSVVKSIEYFAESSEKSGKEPVEESVEEAGEKSDKEFVVNVENTVKVSSEDVSESSLNQNTENHNDKHCEDSQVTNQEGKSPGNLKIMVGSKKCIETPFKKANLFLCAKCDYTCYHEYSLQQHVINNHIQGVFEDALGNDCSKSVSMNSEMTIDDLPKDLSDLRDDSEFASSQEIRMDLQEEEKKDIVEESEIDKDNLETIVEETSINNKHGNVIEDSFFNNLNEGSKKRSSNNHIRKSLERVVWFQCPECDYTCCRAVMLQRHSKRDHQRVIEDVSEFIVDDELEVMNLVKQKFESSNHHLKPIYATEKSRKWERKVSMPVRPRSKSKTTSQVIEDVDGFFITDEVKTKNLVKKMIARQKKVKLGPKYSYCSNKLTNKFSLQSHLKRTHEMKKWFQCPYCTQYTSMTYRSLQKHFQRNHGKKPTWKDIRKFQLTDKNKIEKIRKGSMLKRKKAPHLPSKKNKYQCDECEYATSSRSHLERHVGLAHKMDQWYKCPSCDYVAAYKYDVRKHAQRAHQIYIEDLNGLLITDELMIENLRNNAKKRAKAGQKQKPYVKQ